MGLTDWALGSGTYGLWAGEWDLQIGGWGVGRRD